VVGGDRGVRCLATLSDGTAVPNPPQLKRRLQNTKRFHRVVSRRQQGSQHCKQAVRNLATLSRKVANQRAHTVCQLTTRLTKAKSVLVIEDLNVAGMLRSPSIRCGVAHA
jgi:putative transposase